MTVKNSRIDKVAKFYQALPDDILLYILGNIVTNRELRRNLSKAKTTNAKIELLFDSSSSRQRLADLAYQYIRDKISLDLKTAKYDDIINSITEENKVFVTLFFFRWCYEKINDGLSNDDLYFKTFVDSELFDSILNEKEISKKISDYSENQSVESFEKNESKESTNIMTTAIEQGKVNTLKLLGRIDKRNTFYNFFPQYELKDNRFDIIPSDKLKFDYPINGGINLAYNPYSGAAATFFDEISTDLASDVYVSNLYVIELDHYDLEENGDDTYRVKYDLQKMAQSGKRLHNLIQPAVDYQVYKIVTSELDIIPEKTFISGNINILESNIIEGEYVVLYYNEKYYGPFAAQFRAFDNKYYVKTGASENNYLVNYFSPDDICIIEIEKQAYYKDPTYTPFIHVIGKSSVNDLITDELLLEKILDDISIDLAISNPEEFSHLCSNSPFLARLPQTIISQRIERLQEIIAKVEKFKEKKHEVFESLLKLYQETPSEVSDKMITDSEPYKELQAKYGEERRKNEDAEKQIQDLKKIQDELNTQIAKNSKIPLSTVSSEEMEHLKATIAELEEELEKEKAIATVSANIDALKKEQEKLKHNNEFLNDQAKEYEDRIKTARAEVSNAIETSASNMASLAFDPFISSEMMKQAASWDSKEEDKWYSSLQSQLSRIAQSSLHDKELVDYIVKYVKERREYSRNTIINIYISIAQNFITIFSGEPGIGKTSMCNIIGETLGLFNFGNNINRFVSVSVERGWASKRDLIGYYNPLTKKYDKSNSKIYHALRMLDLERNDSKFPYIIMLDEANLSPIEYYWADFMRLTDRTSQNDMFINIGIEDELYVPNTLRFVATINTDQTTELLSPRLIDRACIIKLPNVEPKHNISHETSSTEIITWDNFVEAFSKTSEINQITQKAIKEIYKLFNDYGMNVSPRIQLGIRNYIMAAQEIMEDEADALARERALDFAIVQKLLPKINGYYSLYERFFDSLKQLCKEYNLKMTEDAVSIIVENQERNMGYCQYLI